MITFNLNEAAAFLRLHPEELRRKAKSGIIPGAKAGKCWVFIDLDLAEYLRSLYKSAWQALRVQHKETPLCHSSNAELRGGLTSPHQAASALDALLAQKIKKAAQEYHDKLKAESWRIEQIGEKPKRSWDEAALKWLQETSHKKTHLKDVAHIAWLQQFFRGKLLTELTKDRISEIAEIKRKEASTSTANRYLALIRAILRRAANEWEWIDKAPFLRQYPEPKRRIRWLTPDQVHILLKELPEHLAEMVIFSLATGLRQANVLGLEWSQVDVQRSVAWIHGDQAKAGRDIHVTLNATALKVLERRLGKHPEFVFTYQDKPIGQVSTKAWYKALKRAGIENFRWHDLRHTWASWLAQGGVPLNVIQEMGAWESVEMVRRYAHLAPEKFGSHAMIVDNMLFGTNPAQNAGSPVIISG